MVDIATRMFNQNWKIDPIVRSLLDTDFYKILMNQFIYRNTKDVEVKFKLINRSKENLIKEKEQISKRLKELGMEDSLVNLKGITQGMLVLLGQRSIKTLSDFADLSSDELIGGFDEVKGKKIRIEGYLEEFSLSREEADQLIMAAREIVFK